MNLDGEPKLPVLISFKFKLWCIVINWLLLRGTLLSHQIFTSVSGLLSVFLEEKLPSVLSIFTMFAMW